MRSERSIFHALFASTSPAVPGPYNASARQPASDDPHMSRIPRSVFFLLFTVSGFAGLIYESIWSHYLKLFLGHAAYAQTLVLGLFMGGMAIGSWLCSRWSAGWRNLLRGYAVAEGLIGIAALAFHPVFVAATDAAYESILPALGGEIPAMLFKWTLAGGARRIARDALFHQQLRSVDRRAGKRVRHDRKAGPAGHGAERGGPESRARRRRMAARRRRRATHESSPRRGSGSRDHGAFPPFPRGRAPDGRGFIRFRDRLDPHALARPRILHALFRADALGLHSRHRLWGVLGAPADRLDRRTGPVSRRGAGDDGLARARRSEEHTSE